MEYSLKTGQRSPLLIEAVASAQKAWADYAEAARKGLIEQGAVLLRGFPIASPKEFRSAVTGLGLVPWDDYLFRETERDPVDDKVFTTNNFQRQSAHGGLHSENCYSPDRPRWLAFFCQRAPQCGGETLLCDAVEAYAQLSGRLRQKFKSAIRECDYIIPQRDYQKVFKTTDPQQVRAACLKADCSVYQNAPGRGDKAYTRTIFRRPYVVEVPETGRQGLLININIWSPLGPLEVWRLFRERHSLADWLAVHANYATSFTYWSIIRRLCAHIHISGQRVVELPLDPGERRELGCAMADQLTAFPWKNGDVLILDNLQMLHCGLPWRGERVLRVMMGTFA